MKKSRIVLYIMLFVVIPATVLLGRLIPGRSWYFLSALIAVEVLIPFFMAFEGRRPQPRELVTVAVMAALAVISRVAIPLPNMKPTFAIIMLVGIAFGPETGFLVGAVGALGSNFFYGQGPFATWQMMGYGLCGLLAGVVFERKLLPRKNWVMGVFSFVCVLFFAGPLLDTSTVLVAVPKITWKTALPVYLAGVPVNVSQGITSFLTMLLFGNAILEKLERVKLQYGMMENYADGV